MELFVEPLGEAPLDVDALLGAYATVRGRVAPVVAARGDDRMRTISLTHRPDAADPIADGNASQFDGAGGMVYREADFSCFNEAFRDTYFWSVYEQLPFAVGRMRLMVLPPLTVYGMHRDGSRRAHIAITSNPCCRLVAGSGVTAHIPVDGRMYVVDTLTEHTAFNAGTTERVHLVMSLADTEAGEPMLVGVEPV